MKGRRLLLIPAGILTALLSLTYASAADSNITTDSLAAGTSAVVSCDPDGIDVSYSLAGDNVSQVTVVGIAHGCVGGELSVVLANGADVSIGQGGPQLVTATSHSVSISAQPIAIDVMALHVVIEGP
jgi:hypothetical protein